MTIQPANSTWLSHHGASVLVTTFEHLAFSYGHQVGLQEKKTLRGTLNKPKPESINNQENFSIILPKLTHSMI
jgi:hypothetical protein